VAEFRFLNTEQILTLHDGSRRNLMERLSRLYHHGFLDRPASQTSARLTSAHMVYSLGRKGAEQLSKDAEEREGIYRRVKEVERTLPLMAHALMISQFRVCLTLAAKTHGVKITRFTQGYDLKDMLRDVHGENPSLVPEAYIDSRIPTPKEIENGVEKMIREAIAFKIKYYNELENKK